MLFEGHAVKFVLSDHIQQDIFWAFQTGGCLHHGNISVQKWPQIST